MSSKQTVSIKSKTGGSGTYTVNNNGTVNKAAQTFCNKNGGNVGKNVPVKTPVSKGGPTGFYLSSTYKG